MFVKRNRLPLLMISFLICFLVFSGPAHGSPTTTAVNSDTVKLVAQNHLKLSATGSLDKWSNATLSDYVPLYDLTGNIKAYGFNVLSKNESIGYIIVSNDKLDAPIPEFGVGGPLPYLNHLDQAKEVAQGKLNGNQTLGEAKYIYPSALTYLVDFPVIEGEKQIGTIRLNLRDYRTLTDKTNDEHRDPINYEKNQKAWLRLTRSTLNVSKSTIVQPMDTVIERVISGVPFYLWYRGCTPTSAAMVMAYWESHGYPNLPTGNALIDELAYEMGTDANGNTWISNVPPAIVDVALTHGYPAWAATNDGEGRAYSTYSEYINEINTGRPLLATVFGSSTYGNHSMAGVGYRYDGYQDWIIVHDTWDTANQKYLDYNAGEVNSPQWTYIYAA